MAERRADLKFENWDEVTQDLRRLEDGYEQAGKWNLEQAAKHLNDWLSYPVVGFPKPSLLLGLMMSAIRLTAGPGMLRKILRDGRMQDGGPTAPNTVYEANAEADPSAAIARLLETIDQFRNHTGSIHRSPIFGAMDKATAEQLQFVHFAHHLSWLVPKTD